MKFRITYHHTMFSAPISSIISTVEPSAVANSKHPFMRNFILPVPDASCPAALITVQIFYSEKVFTQLMMLLNESGYESVDRIC